MDSSDYVVCETLGLTWFLILLMFYALGFLPKFAIIQFTSDLE